MWWLSRLIRLQVVMLRVYDAQVTQSGREVHTSVNMHPASKMQFSCIRISSQRLLKDFLSDSIVVNSNLILHSMRIAYLGSVSWRTANLCTRMPWIGRFITYMNAQRLWFDSLVADLHRSVFHYIKDNFFIYYLFVFLIDYTAIVWIMS